MSNEEKSTPSDETKERSMRTWVIIAILMGIGLGYTMNNTAGGALIGIVLGAVIVFTQNQMNKNK